MKRDLLRKLRRMSPHEVRARARYAFTQFGEEAGHLFGLDKIVDADLPENMRKMNAEQRKEFVETQMKNRAGIQEKILKLNEERNKYVADEMKKKVGDKKESLDRVMAAAAKEQAEKKSFEVK